MTAQRQYKAVSGSVAGGALLWNGSAWVNALVDTANMATTPAGLLQTGTVAPTTGAHLRGEVVWNTTPSSGGTPGWMCTAAGTPGTWKAMANLA